MLLPSIYQCQRPYKKKDKRAKPIDPRLAVPPISIVGTTSTTAVSMSTTNRLSPLAKSRATASRVAAFQSETIDRARRERLYRLTHVHHSTNFHESVPVDSRGELVTKSRQGESVEEPQEHHLGVRSNAVRRSGLDFETAAPARFMTVPKVKQTDMTLGKDGALTGGGAFVSLPATLIPPNSAIGGDDPFPTAARAIVSPTILGQSRSASPQGLGKQQQPHSVVPVDRLESVVARRALYRALNNCPSQTVEETALQGASSADYAAACREVLLEHLPRVEALKMKNEPLHRLVELVVGSSSDGIVPSATAPDAVELVFSERGGNNVIGRGVDETFSAGEVRLLASILSPPHVRER